MPSLALHALLRHRCSHKRSLRLRFLNLPARLTTRPPVFLFHLQ